MAIDPILNKILKEMWRLDEKQVAGETLSREEEDFYNEHFSVITKYYEKQNEYWASKNII